MTSQPDKQTITIHNVINMINISRSKNNQATKIGQLLECNLTNIFLEKPYTKCGGETIPRPFSEKSKLRVSPDQYSKVLYSSFLLYAKLRAIEIY